MTILIESKGTQLPGEDTIPIVEVTSLLRKIRREQKLSQKVFAKQIGISVKKLRDFEKSEDPEVILLQRVLMGLGGKLEIVACFDDKKERIL
jgi:transcriptional regulator with XRE-family HTH domain